MTRDNNEKVLEITIQYEDNTTEQWTRENGWPWQQAEREQEKIPLEKDFFQP